MKPVQGGGTVALRGAQVYDYGQSQQCQIIRIA